MPYSTKQYTRRGLLAIQPSALFESFLVLDDAPRENNVVGDAVIVDVRGPLEQHAHPWCDSYENVAQRVAAACATACGTVCLRIDSPGGDVAGCFDTSQQLRDICAAAGKRLVAFVDGDCCSAAYALACAASTIVATSTSMIGSIGVLSCREDYTAMNAARGLRVELITSGARKADGHPDQPITEQELASTRLIVDGMAQVFYDLVANARGIDAAAVAQLQAQVFHGAAAVTARLVDAVGSLTTAIAAGTTKPGGTMTAYEKAVAALKEAAEGDDANAAAAKKGLAAMGVGEDGAAADDEPADDAPKEDPPKEPAAAGDPPEDDKDKDKTAAAYRVALRAEQQVAGLKAELRQRDERDERRALIDGRPDLSPEMKALLGKAPIALVRETITGMKAARVPVTAREPAPPVRGAGQGDRQPQLPAAEKAALDARMGLQAHTHNAVRSTEYRLELGVTDATAPPAAPPAGAPAAPGTTSNN